MRATETANLILDELPKDLDIEVSSCDLITEGAPVEPEPKHSIWKPDPWVSVQVYNKI